MPNSSPMPDYARRRPRNAGIRAWREADDLFALHNSYLPYSDTLMVKLYKVRGVVGLAIVVVVGARYSGIKSVGNDFDSWAGPLPLTALMAVALAVLFGVVIVAATRPGYRCAATWQLRWPVLTFAALFGAYRLIIFLIHVGGSSGDWTMNKVIHVFLVLWLFMFLTGLIIFTLRGLYVAAIGLCRASDGHPLLGPVIAPLAAWSLAIRGLLADGGSSPIPLTIRLIVAFGGPASITALAILEIVRLRRDYPYDFPFLRGPLKGRG